MSTVFLICGNTAAGKSTYSMKLEKEREAVWFSTDHWMQTLYGSDYMPGTHDFSWLLERSERCRDLMRQISEKLLARGIDVILETGLGNAESRRFYYEWALEQGADVFVHFLDVPVEVRRRQLEKRNSEQGDTFSFAVTTEMFDYVEPMFEPPDASEPAPLVVVKP